MTSMVRLTADRLRFVLVVIAALTIVSGLAQLIAPDIVLGLLDAESTTTTRHFFAIVGMFMTVIGALLVQALLTDLVPPYVVLWCGIQKFGAFVAVTVAVVRDLFSALALLVALFDLATALLAAAFWYRLQRERVPASTTGAAA